MKALRLVGKLAALSLAVGMAAWSAHARDGGSVVRAATGPVRGISADGIRSFKGIPYALPPVGARRWAPPVAIPPWKAVRDATAFGPACRQPGYPAGSIYAETYSALSEDCLSLNVWTPDKARKAPVFVWIHGGNLVRGSSQQPLFDGSEMAKRGVVVVSINYRLGIFGYFAHPELSAESGRGISGNYGLQDQVAALIWVRRNVGAFGGDPANVTIAGESAGGLAILHLMASPDARGLFAKAIVQSASLMSLPELKQARFGAPSGEELGAQVAARMRAKSLADLRAIEAPELVKRASAAGFASTAIVDGALLPRQLIETFERGEQAPVPLLTGFTAGEIRTMRSILPGLPDPAKLDGATYEAAIRRNYVELADEFLDLYPAANSGESILAAARDGFFAWTSQRLVREQARIGQPAYLYLFDHGYPAADEGGMHAFHASEVPYMFGTIDRMTPLWPAIPQTAAERSLSDAMVDYWTSFARTGRPQADAQPVWPSHRDESAYILFAGQPKVAKDLLAREYALHDGVVCRRRAAGTAPWNWNVGVIAPPLSPATVTCR